MIVCRSQVNTILISTNRQTTKLMPYVESDVVQALKETHPTLPKLPKFKQREGGHEAVIIKSKEMVDDDSDSD